MNTLDDDLPPGDPAESLRLIEHERAEVAHRLVPDPRLQHWPWGLAWLIGFMAFFLRFGPGGRRFVDLPDWLPVTMLLGLTIVAGMITGVVGARANRAVAGRTSRQGGRYSITWSVAFIGLWAVLGRVSPMLPYAQGTLLWTGTMVAMTGALHMAGGAVFDDRALFRLGAFISGVNIVGVLAGPGWHALIVAVAGGGGLLVAGLLSWLRWRR